MITFVNEHNILAKVTSFLNDNVHLTFITIHGGMERETFPHIVRLPFEEL